MIKREILLKLNEGDKVRINDIPLIISRFNSDIIDDKKNVPDDVSTNNCGNWLFLNDELENEYYLYVPEEEDIDLIFQKIMRYSISYPQKYKVLKEIKIKKMKIDSLSQLIIEPENKTNWFSYLKKKLALFRIKI